MNYTSTPKSVLLISAAAFLARLISALFFAEFDNPEMWEFGQIARSLLNGEGFLFMANTVPVPSAFMPPGLPYLYYFLFSIFGDNQVSYFIIIFLNSVLSGISVFLVYILAKKLYSEQVGIYSAIYVCLSPVYIFSSLTYNSLIIYHVLILLLFINLINSFEVTETLPVRRVLSGYKDVLLLSVVLGVFLYFRSEMLGFAVVISLLYIVKKRILSGLAVVIIPILMILPWTIRNYNTFGEFVPISTSVGYNFYSGHSDDPSTISYLESVSKLKEDSTFEIKKSELSFEHAKKYIIHHPYEEFIESLRKIFSLWVIDLYRNTAKHPFYLAVWLPTLLLFLAGLFRSQAIKPIMANLKFLILYLLFSTAIVVVFFNIPRYQIQMSIVIIPTAMFGLHQIIKSIRNKTKS